MVDEDSYLSLATASAGFYRERGSKFYAHAYPVVSEAAVGQHLEALRKQYHDARHHCYAFVLKPREGQEAYARANDDGEPPHSAGDPILGQLRSSEVLDALVVVVRYFGGTKLGVGGLINAYKTAAADALHHNRTVRRVRTATLAIRFAYTTTSEVQQLMHRYDVDIANQQFAEDCYYQLQVPQSKLAEIKQQLVALKDVRLE